eukprot:7946173-Karenia_brevis.AAC.1
MVVTITIVIQGCASSPPHRKGLSGVASWEEESEGSGWVAKLNVELTSLKRSFKSLQFLKA